MDYSGKTTAGMEMGGEKDTMVECSGITIMFSFYLHYSTGVGL